MNITPNKLLLGMYWSFAEPVPESPRSFIVAARAYAADIAATDPSEALEAQLPRNAVKSGIEKSRDVARTIDALLKPRLTFLSKPPFVNLVALMVIAAALITFPLGLVPFAPIAPGLAVVFFGLGMVARDGLWLALGTAAMAGAFLLAKPLIL